MSFILILPAPNLMSFFLHFHINIFFKNISYPYYSLNLCDEYHFNISMTVIKVVKNLIFQKSLTSLENRRGRPL